MSTRTAKPQTSKFIQPTATATLDERRRRPRLVSEAVGYLACEDAQADAEPWEVRVHDVSRHGVGFVTSDAMSIGTICRIRIGYGPMRLARRMHVTYCEPQSDNTFRVGAEFA